MIMGIKRTLYAKFDSVINALEKAHMKCWS